MDAIDQLKQDLRDGRIDSNRLFDVILMLQQQLQAAKQRIAELESRLGGPASPATPKVDQPFSLRAEEKRQHKLGKKKLKLSRHARRGRFTSKDKLKLAQRTEKCFPEGVSATACQLSHTRPVWRLENGRAILIAYEIYRGPNNQYGKIAGVLGRSEFGMEIVVEIAYFVYVMGLSFDKVCLTLQFLQNLNLKKTQADRLLHQLARHWQNEFEVLCTLLANSMVVHADETSWSINSVWAFLSEKARLLLFGVHKDARSRPFCAQGSAAGVCPVRFVRDSISVILPRHRSKQRMSHPEWTDRLPVLLGVGPRPTNRPELVRLCPERTAPVVSPSFSSAAC
jgi:transposase